MTRPSIWAALILPTLLFYALITAELIRRGNYPGAAVTAVIGTLVTLVVRFFWSRR